jgi:hypothetical protein
MCYVPLCSSKSFLQYGREVYHDTACIPSSCSGGDGDQQARLKYAAASHSSREVLLRVAPALKDEILDMINDEFGTAYELDSPAVGLFEDAEVLQRKVLPEIGGVGAAGGTWAALLGGGDLVSSDTDDDYEWR